jgi:hypothetical protein
VRGPGGIVFDVDEVVAFHSEPTHMHTFLPTVVSIIRLTTLLIPMLGLVLQSSSGVPNGFPKLYFSEVWSHSQVASTTNSCLASLRHCQHPVRCGVTHHATPLARFAACARLLVSAVRSGNPAPGKRDRCLSSMGRSCPGVSSPTASKATCD